MSRIGTDVVALAAILGSAAVGGVVTLAALDRGPEPASADCVVTSVVSAPRVVVSSGHGSHSIVIAPSAHAHGMGACLDGTERVVVDEVVRVEVDRVQAEIERAMAELEESRVKLEREYEMDIQRQLTEEMARLEKELARLDDEVGR